MMNVDRIRLAGVLLLTGLMAGACSPGVERLDGQAAPAGIAAPSTPPPATTAASTTKPSTSPSSSPSTSKASPIQQRLVLGPDGLGGLKLRMTREQAEATGLIEGYEVEDFTGNCGIARLRSTGDGVHFTPGLGLSSIDAPDGVRTPQGIRIGSTLNELQQTYPSWEDLGTGYGWVKVPGNSRNSFRIDVRNSKVSYITLTTEGQKCVE
jgi:hypothetical protein